MTKTATLPTVAAAEQQLADAHAAHTEATAALDQLKAAILMDGPTAVTAQDLGAAADRAEHAGLAVQHARAEHAAAQERDRRQALRDLKNEILTGASNPQAALAAMRQFEDAAAALIATCCSRQRNISQWTRAMRQHGVPRANNQPAAEQHEGLAWADAGLGRSDHITVDGRTIADINPGVIITAALHRAASAAGYTVRHLAPALDVGRPDPAAVNDPGQWFNARY
ncbi:hypothetical protein ACFYOY_13990 [Streptomyces sp. NPDC007875]|uniref:hypothetical protein n=1 Tax=Streptomyces sp. NPDC007875 TaxID=3364783 RepID=UPI0036B8FFB7